MVPFMWYISFCPLTFNIFNKIQNAFMIKILKLGIEGKFLNLIKDIYKNLQVTSCLNINASLQRSGIRKDVL